MVLDQAGRELDERGYSSIAMDLPCEDPKAGAIAYAEAVLQAVALLDDELVVVGHSLGGVTIPLVADAIAVRTLVFLTPATPRPGASRVEAMATEAVNAANPLTYLEPIGNDWLRCPPRVCELPYHRCQPADAAWASGKLRLEARTPLVEGLPLERHPDVPTAIVLGRHDRLMDVTMMSSIAWRRLRVEPIVIESDHSPCLGAPALMADLLVELALTT